MDFDFSAEQKMFKEQVRRALEAACPLTEVRRVLEGEDPYSAEAWAAVRALGVTGAAIPEAYGGLGLGYYELCVAAEELGRALAPVPLASSIYLAAEALLIAGGEAQKQTWLPRLAAGDAIAAFADGGQERPRFAGGRLAGRTLPAADAARAAFAILPADEGTGVSLVLVPLDQAGVQRRPLDTVDASRDLAELVFDGARAERLGPAGDAEAILEAVRQKAAILLAFEQLGGAERSLDMARAYATERKAFGRQIGSYQAIKHKLANVYIKLEVARAHAYYGAWALSTQSADLPLAAAAARVAATEAFAFAAQENIQTHGGMGFTWEADCHLFYRRARLLALQLGSVLEWKERLVSELDRRNAH